MSWTVTLDPAAVAQSTPRTELSLDTGPIRIYQRGIDWGDAQIQAYLADRKVGSVKIDFRVPNRKVVIPLLLGADASGTQETVRAQLQQKVGLFQRENGVLLRQRSGGQAMYADVIDAVLTLPDVWGQDAGVEPDVNLVLECLPDFYGDEITLDAVSGTGALAAPLTAAGATNLLANPSFEYDRVGSAPAAWNALASTLTVAASHAVAGDNACHCAGAGIISSPGGSTAAGLSGMPVLPTVSYTFSIGVFVTAISGTVSAGLTARILWYDAAGTFLSQSDGAALTVAAANAYRPTVTAAAPANAAFASVRWYVSFTTVNTFDAYADAAILSRGAVYFDGDTPGYTWLGTPGNSPSRACAVIDGDHAARCRILVTDTSGHDQQGLVWALQSRHRDSAQSARLRLEAEELTPLDAAAVFTHAGASGGKTVRHNSLPGGAWCPVLLTDLLAGAAGLTHEGSYQVWARVYSATATPQLRLSWGVGDVAHPVVNDPVQVPGAGGFYLISLGQVRLDKPPVGGYRWHGVIQALAAVQGDPVELDCLYLQPLDESAGQLSAVQSPSAFGISYVKPAGAGADDASVGTQAWNLPGAITVEDGTSAYALGTSSPIVSHYLIASPFGFAIPAGATISGIQVDVKRSSLFAPVAFDSRVRLIKATTIQTPDKADTLTPWPSSLAFKSYGGPVDLWGGAWTPADVNDPGFGVALSVAIGAGGGSTVALVDFIRITVSYTTAGGWTSAQDAVCHASQSCELRSDGVYREDSTGSVEGTVAKVIGDLPRLPPSGMEGRPVALFVKPSRGDLDQLADSALDSFSAQVIYRPSWLFRP